MTWLELYLTTLGPRKHRLTGSKVRGNAGAFMAIIGFEGGSVRTGQMANLFGCSAGYIAGSLRTVAKWGYIYNTRAGKSSMWHLTDTGQHFFKALREKFGHRWEASIRALHEESRGRWEDEFISAGGLDGAAVAVLRDELDKCRAELERLRLLIADLSKV